MEAVGIAASLHQTARELVHDDDFVTPHHIVTVTLHDGLGPKGCGEAVGKLDVFRGIEIGNAQHLLDFGNGAVSRSHSLLLFIHGVVRALFQAGHSFGHNGVHIRGFLAGAGNNQRRTGLIHQNGVHLIHDGKIQLPLHHLVLLDNHVVAEVVEAELVIGTESHVAAIGVLSLGEIHIMGNKAYGEAQEFIKMAHPLAVALGQVVVHRNHVHTLAGEGIQVHRQGCHQGLAFTGAHFGNAALVEAHAADELHIKVAHAQDAAGSLAGHRKGLGQDIVQGLTVGQPLLELSSAASELVISKVLHLRLQGIDFLHYLAIAGDFFIIIVT